MKQAWRLLLFALLAVFPARASDRVRIGVFGLFHPTQIVVEATPASPVLVEVGTRQLMLGVGSVQRARVNLVALGLEVQSQARRLRGERLVARSRPGGDAEFVLAVPGKIRRRYVGRLVITGTEKELLLAVEMDMETAVASIVAAESPSNALSEALKAQAVVTRSYLAAGAPRHRYAEFCDTTHCQFLREPPEAGSPANRATQATRGLVLAWQGKPFPAMYSAACGGRTHSLAEVGLTAVDYPYFAVVCEHCRKAPETWKARVGRQDLDTRRAHQEATRIQTGRKLGWSAVPSNSYVIENHGESLDLLGAGRGHGVGLCQTGAAALAKEGKNFREILANYFPETSIAQR